MRYISKYIAVLAAAMFMCPLLASAQSTTQDKKMAEHMDTLTFSKDAPMMSPYETPKRYYIRNVNIHGTKYIDKKQFLITSGINPGDSIYLPGGEGYIANAIDRLWRQRYFSDVKMGATIEGDSLDIEILLQERPKVHHWYIMGDGIGPGKQKDLIEKLKLRTGMEMSDYIIDKNKKLLAKEFANKGFRNTEVTALIENDSIINNAVNVTFNVKRNSKVKIGKITFSGNEQFPEKRLR
ncbi:MAG: outer membrane protein assembly factor BamA, partial [Alistipes sp.]|nr:outer membrane protein assembly factor BamA [Alistipes sp.]